jgi:hypothetical protein
MANGYSLHIGLNAVDPRHYQGWSGDLLACEFDANDMALIADARGIADINVLLTRNATRNAVSEALEATAKRAAAGDFFFLTYSGHGGQLPDLNGDEDDGDDETWCLFDGEMLDDEIFAHLGKFKKGVRVFVFSDSCHSGTVLKNMRLADARAATAAQRYRAIPPEFAQRTYLANRKFYDELGNRKKNAKGKQKVEASALLISGCQDNQLSSDGTFNGLFTAKVKQVWNGGKFKGTYRQFFKAIRRIMPPDQTPNYFWAGASDLAFEQEQPFTV